MIDRRLLIFFNLRYSLVVILVAVVTAAILMVPGEDDVSYPAEQPPRIAIPMPIEQRSIVVVDEEPKNPLLIPEAMGVQPELLAQPLSEDEKRAMADELDRIHTRDSWELVTVISDANPSSHPSVPVSLMVSIAWAETRGKILLISPAGAAGLAQATPSAYLIEGGTGPLFLTNDYLIGTRAFIMKKPLGDAVTIAERVAEGRMSRVEGLELLGQAEDLRRVGIDELEVLEPRAPEIFMQRVEAADDYNARVLAELRKLLEHRAAERDLLAFRDRIRKEYRTLLRVQQETWKRYADALENERNRLLRAQYGEDPVIVMRSRPYEAGELLGERLDGRFSPTQMAHFLAAHLDRKRQQAMALGIVEDELEQWTAALYNGGLVNVTRMRAGLIGSIQETQSYMQKVPELRARLEDARVSSGS